VERALNSRDLEAAVALYEPNASLLLASGEVVTGHSAIREALRGFFAFDDIRFTREISVTLNGDGSIAMLRAAWSAKAPGLMESRLRSLATTSKWFGVSLMERGSS